jgi:uncharacterized membrane protein YoaK (UPF0700 family)
MMKYMLLCLLALVRSEQPSVASMTTSSCTTKTKRIETWSKAHDAVAPLVLASNSFVDRRKQELETSNRYALELVSNSFVYRGGESADRRRVIHPLFFSSSMAALAGCSHVLCIKRFQCYAAMMTGNIIGLGVALAEANMSEAKFRSSLLGSFFAGTICARALESRSVVCKDKQHHKVVAPIAVGAFAIADRIPDGQKRKLVLLSAAYGLVYASANQALNATITQLMTSHVTKLGAAISDCVGSANRCFNTGTITSLCILVSFTIGCGLGARIAMFGQEKPIFTILGFIYAVLLLLFRG